MWCTIMAEGGFLATLIELRHMHRGHTGTECVLSCPLLSTSIQLQPTVRLLSYKQLIISYKAATVHGTNECITFMALFIPDTSVLNILSLWELLARGTGLAYSPIRPLLINHGCCFALSPSPCLQ